MPNNSSTFPTVSVIMPVYNGQKFLTESIESVLNQTFQDFEFIIIHDASPDNSLEIIKQYAKNDTRIKIIDNKTNQGQSGSANIGYRSSQGRFIARMDQDDIWLPQKLEKQVTFLNENPDYFFVGTQVMIIDRSGKKIGLKKYPTHHQDILKRFGISLPFTHPAIMIRKSMVHTPDRLWFEEGDPIPDTYTFFYYVTREKFANLPQVLMKYRMHESNGSFENVKYIFGLTIKFRIHAIRHWGYPFRIELPFIWLIQAIPVYLLPNKLVTELFFVWRGIKRLDQAFPIFKPFFKNQ